MGVAPANGGPSRYRFATPPCRCRGKPGGHALADLLDTFVENAWRMRGMNAQEHYREAERLLGLHRPTHDPAGPPGDTTIARAQVHATLALAAATAQANGSPIDVIS